MNSVNLALTGLIMLGVRVGLFTPSNAFEVVVKKRIAELKGPCLKLIELVVEEIRQIITGSIGKVGLIIHFTLSFLKCARECQH